MTGNLDQKLEIVVLSRYTKQTRDDLIASDAYMCFALVFTFGGVVLLAALLAGAGTMPAEPTINRGTIT